MSGSVPGVGCNLHRPCWEDSPYFHGADSLVTENRLQINEIKSERGK